MATLRIAILWHMHQPFYKDLVTGDYRLPWVRMHALKDYYGMVKLLDEFPNVHQTFNLVPSLVTQLEEYVAGSARDPFLDVASKPAGELSSEERRFALEYLFYANPTQMIGRYPRYRELWDVFRGAGQDSMRAERMFQAQDFTDLQVLSQLAWFDEFFLEQPDVAALVKKGRKFSRQDQEFVTAKQREIMAAVLPAYAAAARRGGIEISTSPFYHPILPLVCDTDQGAVSHPGLHLPQSSYRQPDDAREQLRRGLDLHQRVFGARPLGVWPSEGSVSEQVLDIACQSGIRWMATDEGVLGRTLGCNFARDGRGQLAPGGAERLYAPYVYEKGATRMNLVFRDHTLSDLIGFVYSGMNAQDAANHFVRSIKQAAEPVLRKGSDALVAVILDGENAWEYYPRSGREFLRRVYDALQKDAGLEAVTISQAIARHRHAPRLASLVPGSWINANFDVWIGAPEDNTAWDYLAAARAFYAQAAPMAPPEKRRLALEEILIAEGSDWNWWYGPEHHSANDREFDELYRKHLSNVYQTLGAAPPVYLAHAISGGMVRPVFAAQTAYIHPRVHADFTRYFDWIGAAMYTADRRAGAMHGKVFLLDAIYAGIDEDFLYGRLDFIGGIPQEAFELIVTCDRAAPAGDAPASAPGGTRKLVTDRAPASFRLELKVEDRAIKSWRLRPADSETNIAGSDVPYNNTVRATLYKNVEFQIPLALLGAGFGQILQLRFSLWRDHLPVDALPVEGTMELGVISEDEMSAGAMNYSAFS
ncbi:MAG: glycoside hydrolase family 57 protein [Terriglobales bacterium]|jgi:alpha-amylase/alpha-mannosidase (GH57 family)